MRIVFVGTPKFAVYSFCALFDSLHEIAAVVTQPDRPKGRHLRPSPSPVKETALRLNIPIFQPETLNDEATKKGVTGLHPHAVVVVAYGKMIPEWLLKLPSYGCINVHPSLLPKYRGAAPIQRAIMAGERKTGVTVQFMLKELDAGDILLQEKVTIEDKDSAETLEKKLAEKGAELLLKALDGLFSGRISPKTQDEGEATYASKITKEEAKIDWSKEARRIRDLVRALNPQPGAYTLFKNKRLKIWRVEFCVPNLKPRMRPGEVIVADKKLVVFASPFPLELLEVQPEGKKAMSGAEFVRGYRIKVGDVFC